MSRRDIDLLCIDTAAFHPEVGTTAAAAQVIDIRQPFKTRILPGGGRVSARWRIFVSLQLSLNHGLDAARLAAAPQKHKGSIAMGIEQKVAVTWIDEESDMARHDRILGINVIWTMKGQVYVRVNTST